jgi:hypothetical protein
LVVRAQVDSEQAAQKVMDKVVELDSMADETTLAAAVTAKEEAIKIKHGTERSVLLHHRGDALGTLRLLTKLKFRHQIR